MQLSPRRLLFGTSTALVLAALAASVVTPRATAHSARHQAAEAAARLESALTSGDATTRALSLAYLERVRLGLGSPFRVIDQAVHDPRLADSARQAVAWSIVDRMFRGDFYQIDARALDLVSSVGAGAGHLEILDDVIASSDDPRTAEAAVRIAYALASENGSTSLTSLAVVAEAAAQVRDRVLAANDLRRAVQRAQSDGVDLITELVHSRVTHDLDVEKPVLGPLSVREREAAIEMAPRILRRIEEVAVRSEEPSDFQPLLDRKAALQLADLATQLPPLAAIRVPVSGRAATLRTDSALDRSAIAVVGAAVNEESLVAAYAYADAVSDGRSSSLRRLMVSAGVSLRAHAQDRAWFTSEPQPSAGAAIGRFGLKAITFDKSIPRDWRPFYVTMIASALEDFQRAVPAYDPRTLSFSVEMGPLPDSALAMHDPRTHTIRLSVMTPSGTLAHELAHDVDWQAARRLFAKNGGYATDRSMHEGELRLSSSVRGLTSARIAGRGRISPRGSSRPAEVFARSVDWYVADALAADGRSNGYLTAIQDPLLAGFAATPSDAPSLGSASALMGTLAEMTYVPDSMSTAFVSRWGKPEALDPATIVTRVMDAPVFPRRGGRAVFGLTPSMITSLATGSLCRVDAMREGSAEERLLAMAIDARAEGMIVRRSRYGAPMLRLPEDRRLVMARVTDAVARAGLIELAPAPFRPNCG